MKFTVGSASMEASIQNGVLVCRYDGVMDITQASALASEAHAMSLGRGVIEDIRAAEVIPKGDLVGEIPEVSAVICREDQAKEARRASRAMSKAGYVRAVFSRCPELAHYWASRQSAAIL